MAGRVTVAHPPGPDAGLARVWLIEAVLPAGTFRIARADRAFTHDGAFYSNYDVRLDPAPAPSATKLPSRFRLLISNVAGDVSAVAPAGTDIAGSQVRLRLLDATNPAAPPLAIEERCVNAADLSGHPAVLHLGRPRGPRSSGRPTGAKRPPAWQRLRRRLRRSWNEILNVAEERLKRPKLTSWPVCLNLTNTLACNLRCSMCQQTLDEIPQRVMDIELYRKVRDELFEHISEVSLTTMGEPLCVPRGFLEELISDIERFDLRLHLTTNATLFGSTAQLDRLAAIAGIVMISIDGASRETYERIRARGRWDWRTTITSPH